MTGITMIKYKTYVLRTSPATGTMSKSSSRGWLPNLHIPRSSSQKVWLIEATTVEILQMAPEMVKRELDKRVQLSFWLHFSPSCTVIGNSKNFKNTP